MIGRSEPTWRLDAVGSKPTYAVTGPDARWSPTPGVDVWTKPLHSSSPRNSAYRFVLMADQSSIFTAKKQAVERVAS
jgi:hypothetical protein